MMRKLMIVILFSSFFSILYGQNGLIHLEVTNLEKPKGKLHIAIFDAKEDFLKKGREFRKKIVDVNAYKLSLILGDLPTGEYAIALFHDENEDNKCNKNIFGIPKEAYGFSRNFRPVLDPPCFDKVKINVEANSHTMISVKMLN